MPNIYMPNIYMPNPYRYFFDMANTSCQDSSRIIKNHLKFPKLCLFKHHPFNTSPTFSNDTVIHLSIYPIIKKSSKTINNCVFQRLSSIFLTQVRRYPPSSSPTTRSRGCLVIYRSSSSTLVVNIWIIPKWQNCPSSFFVNYSSILPLVSVLTQHPVIYLFVR